MPKVDLESVPANNATGYPDPFHREVQGRWWKRIAPLGGLTEMGASDVTLEPGAWSSQRHWHDGEDELVVMLSGRAVLVEDDGETDVGPGDVLAWSKGSRNGHHLVNRADAPCRFIAISAGRNTGGGYSVTFGKDPSEAMTFYGKYLEVTPPSRLVWTNDEGENGAVTTVIFEEEGGKTRLTLSELYPSKEALEAGRGAEEGLPEQFAQLDELLASLSGSV